MTLRIALTGIGISTVCAALTGCGSQIGTEEGIGCVVVTTEAIVDLETAPSGFELTPQAALDQALGSFSGELAPDDGGAAIPMTLTLSNAGTVSVQRREVRGDSIEPAQMPECEDVYAFKASVYALASQTLNDVAQGEVLVDIRGWTEIAVSIPYADLIGEAELGFDPAEYDIVTLDLYAGAELDGGYNGVVMFTGETTGDASDPDSAVSATSHPVGSFDLARDVDE